MARDLMNMSLVVHLRVNSEILALAAQPAEHGFVTIPAGSMIDTSGDLAQPGLHHVFFRGQDLLAFTRDIRERTNRITASNSLPERSKR